MKERIKKVLELFALDWKRIYKNKLTFLLILALMVIPSLYAWFNIAALWDPYSNTGDIKIGVYSDDKTVKLQGKEINIGHDLVDNLKNNDTLGWQFVTSKEELDKKVKSGDYYAGIYIPSNFSDNLLSVVDGKIKYPEIDYQVNQKINAIAPKISDKGASTLQETITTEFVETASKTLLEVFNEVGFNLDANLPSIRKATSKLLLVDDNLDVIDDYTKDVLELKKKMPEYKDKLNLANEFVDYFPELNKMTDKVVDLNGRLPEIAQYGQVVYDVQGNIPNIKNAGAQLNKADQDMGRIVKMMDDAVTEATQGLEVIQTAQEVLPDVTQLINTTDHMVPELQQQISDVSDALPQITAGLIEGLKVLDTLSKASARLAADIASINTEEQAAHVQDQLVKLDAQLASQVQMIDTLIQTLTDIANLPNGPDMSGPIQSLEHMKTQVLQVKSQVEDILANWPAYAAAPGQLQARLEEVSRELGEIVMNVDPQEIENSVSHTISDIQDMLNSAKNITGTIIADGTMSTLDQLLKNTTVTINEAIQFLKEYQQEMPAIQEEVHAANTLLNSNMDLIIGGINDGASFFRNDFPKVQDKMGRATDFIKSDLPGIEDDIKETMGKVNDKMPLLDEALDAAETMIKEDWPNIKDGIHKASDAIRKGEETVDLEDVIKFLKRDVNAESDFISSPIKLKQIDVYPVPNYGSASTPFYTALCLWVGAVLFSSIASTKFYFEEDQKGKYSKRQQFLARMGTFLVVGFFQTLIVVLGNQFLLGTYTKNPVLNVLFALLIGQTFMVMVYVLVALFDNLGKGIAIIILVLSISAGGGNFPIEMSGPFFRWVNPYIPFTHAVDLLRESVGGVYWPTAWKEIVILVCVTIGFSIVGYVLYPRAERLFKKVDENLKEGRILH